MRCEGTAHMSQDCFAYIIWMIHACADRWKVTPSRVYRALKSSGCMWNYLVPNYDILHTQSTEYVAEDIEDYIRREGVTV